MSIVYVPNMTSISHFMRHDNNCIEIQFHVNIMRLFDYDISFNKPMFMFHIPNMYGGASYWLTALPKLRLYIVPRMRYIVPVVTYVGLTIGLSLLESIGQHV